MVRKPFNVIVTVGRSCPQDVYSAMHFLTVFLTTELLTICTFLLLHEIVYQLFVF